MSENITEQTEQALTNIKSILEASGSSLDRVLKVNMYLVDKADYAGMNEVYARVCIEISRAESTVLISWALPGDAGSKATARLCIYLGASRRCKV